MGFISDLFRTFATDLKPWRATLHPAAFANVHPQYS